MSWRIVKSFADRQARRMERLSWRATRESEVGLEGETRLEVEAGLEGREAGLEGREAGLMQAVHGRHSHARQNCLV